MKKILQYLLLLCIVFACSIPSYAQLRKIFIDEDAESSQYQKNNAVLKFSFYSASEGYVAFSNGIGYTTDSGKTFTRKNILTGNTDLNGYSVNLTLGFTIKGVNAIDQGHIVVYGHYGLVPAILYSQDGGGSYKLVFHSQYDPNQLRDGIADMIFPENNLVGYAVDPDRILKTTDGGHNWSVITIRESGYLDHIIGIDNDHMFAYSTSYAFNKMIKTTNGGASWETVLFPSLPLGKMKSAFFLTPNIGWLSITNMNTELLVYKTINAGSTWILQNNNYANPFSTNLMKFTDENTGYALGGLYTVWKTLNSGATWEPLPRDNGFTYQGYTHNDLQCFSATQIWAGGGFSLTELSTNGGGTPLLKTYFTFDTTGVDQTGKVQLTNFSRPGSQYKWYVNDMLVGTTYNTSYNHVLSSESDIIKLVVVSGSKSDSAEKIQQFVVPVKPVFESFFPVTGSPGTLVTIKGTGFTKINSVKFGNTAAASFTILSATQIAARIGAGATGSVTVSDNHYNLSLPGFTYYPPPSTPPPSINTIIPASGPVGTTVKISGNNFSSTAPGNVVFFGSMKAIITSASSNEIICKVPVGTSFEPISVLNKSNNLRGQLAKPFNVTFADSADFGPHSFTVVDTLMDQSYISPVWAKGADIDGDGKPDIVSASIERLTDYYNNYSLLVYRNTSINNSFSFEQKVNGPQYRAKTPGDFETADMDGDGKQDIVTANGIGFVAIARNTSSPGNISFAPRYDLPYSNIGTSLAICDFDNDGKPDILGSQYNDKKIMVNRNTSVPNFLSFSDTINFNCSGHPGKIVTADLDGDGKSDIMTLNYNPGESASVSIFKNTGIPGSISFQNVGEFVVTDRYYFDHISLVDIDNDNKPDLVCNGSSFKNISSGTNIAFAPGVVVSDPSNFSISNLSGDDKPDMLTQSEYTGILYQSRNKSVAGSIKFDPGVFQLGDYSLSFTNTGDFNLDGKEDILLGLNSYTGTLSILANNVGKPVTVNACPSNSFQLYTSIPGAGFQWQQNNGNGFTNLQDTGSLSGTQTNLLNFSNLPASNYNYRYRCAIDDKYSETFIIAFQNGFNGSVSNEWENPANWNCHQLPDANTDVLITGNEIVINSDAVCRSLKLLPSTVLKVKPGAKLTIKH